MENSVNTKQNRKVMIFACILSVISIGLLTLGFFLVSSDKVVLLQSVSNLFNKFNEQTESSSILIDKMASSKNIGINSDININFDEYDIDLNLDYLENKENKKSKIILDANVNDEKVLDANLILVDEKVHMFIEKITPNYYNTDLEYISIFSELKSSDYDQIKTLLKDVITDYIDDEDITKEKVKIIYNEKEKRVNKITYEITNKSVKDVTTNFFNTIKEDKVLFENIAKYFNKTTSELETSMNEILLSLDYEEEQVLYNYIIYYYGFNKIVGYEIEELESNIVLEYKIQNNETINIYEEQQHLLNLNVIADKDEYDFNGFIQSDEEKVEFTGTIIGNIITISMEDMKSVVTYISEESNHSYEYDINLYQIKDDAETKLVDVNIKTQYYFDKEIDVNLENSISIDDITEEETNIIYNNLMNHPLYILISDYPMIEDDKMEM